MTRKPTIKPPLVVRLMSTDPNRFGQMLDVLGLGGTFASAAAVAGVSPSAFRRGWQWANEHCDRKDAKRFLRLTREAIGRARGLTEAEVRQSDPKFWLLHGPGKLLDNEWAAPTEEHAEDKNLITQRELVAALVILRNARISIDELIDSGRIYSAISIEPGESNTSGAGITLQSNLLDSQSNNSSAGLISQPHTQSNTSSPQSAGTILSPNAGVDGAMSAAPEVYMESPHTSPQTLPKETVLSPQASDSNTPHPLVDEAGVGEIFFIDENTSKVPTDANLHRTGRDIEPSRLLDLHKRKDEEMTPDEIKKKAVADLVRNRKEWLKDAEVEVRKEKTPVKRRKLLPQPPELGKHTKPEEYDMEALEQIEDEMSHLPSSLRKFLGED